MNTKLFLTTSLLAATAGLAHGQCDNTLLLAPDRQPLDNLGYSVSAGGGWLAMGAYLDDNVRGTNAGSVYMWRKVNGSWQYYSRMQCPDNGPLFYGQAVSTVMPSSSASSRTNASRGVSPASTLPPGNSQ